MTVCLLICAGYCKITDFGLSKVIPHLSSTMCGTPDYLAPEIMFNKVRSCAWSEV